MKFQVCRKDTSKSLKRSTIAHQRIPGRFCDTISLSGAGVKATRDEVTEYELQESKRIPPQAGDQSGRVIMCNECHAF